MKLHSAQGATRPSIPAGQNLLEKIHRLKRDVEFYARERDYDMMNRTVEELCSACEELGEMD